MKVILPVAGMGSRLKPFTISRPKCLLSIAGKSLLEHIFDAFSSLSVSGEVLVAGYLAKEVERFVEKKGWKQVKIVRQEHPQGLAEAISLAMPEVSDDEPLLIILGDTLFETDLSFLEKAKTNVILTRKVDSPERFGVVVKDASGNVVRLVEKPSEFVSNEAIVGIYYIRDVRALRESLSSMIENNVRTRGEFQLTDALQKMVESGSVFKTAPLTAWLDCGTPETLLETNTAVLKKLPEDLPAYSKATICHPCFIGKNVRIENSTIGPNVSIDDNVCIVNSRIENSLVGESSHIENSEIFSSVLGEGVRVKNFCGEVFLGDFSSVSQND